MAKKPFTPEKVIRTVAKYKDLMGLDQWDIAVNFSVDNGETDYAAATINSPYFSAIISVNLDLITDEATLERKIIHELAHVFLSQYVSAACKLAGKRGESLLIELEEQMVTNLERWPLWDKLGKKR